MVHATDQKMQRVEASLNRCGRFEWVHGTVIMFRLRTPKGGLLQVGVSKELHTESNRMISLTSRPCHVILETLVEL